MSRRPDLWKAELRDRETARKADEAARELPVERTCAACGVFGASFGFGVMKNRSDGMWSCGDRECRAIVEAQVTMSALIAAE